MREISGAVVTDGLVMKLATPFNFKSVLPEDRVAAKDEMIGLVSWLHAEYLIVHGDIKLPNSVRCRDGKLRLCDFDSAWRMGVESSDEWEGFVSERYWLPAGDFRAS